MRKRPPCREKRDLQGGNALGCLYGPLDFVERLYKGIVYEGGADHIVVADPHGSSLTRAIYAFTKKVRSWLPGVPVEMH